MEDTKVTCACADVYKTLRWESEKVSERFNAEYQYCDCSNCNKSVYAGICRMADKLNQNKRLSAKEQKNMSSKDKLTVSKAIKSLHAKNGKGLSLKEFARRLVRDGNELAKDWFANKGGATVEARSKLKEERITAEKAATKSAKKSSKSGAKK